MKPTTIAALGAVLVLAGCGSAGDGKPAGEATAEASAPAAADAGASAAATPVALASGAEPTKEFMVGKWGEAGDCVMAIDFRADGSTDGPFGNWALAGGVLSMSEAPQKVHVVVVDDKTMESRLDGKGEPKMMTRCP